MYIDPNPTLQALARKAFDYQGRKFEILPAESVNCISYWDGGSRTFYAVASDKGLEIMGESGGLFQPKSPVIQLTPGNMVISHSIVYGKDHGITILVHPSRIPQFLPASQAELTRHETIVLVATRSVKSTYAGVNNYRFIEARRHTGIAAAEYEAAKEDCIVKGYLNKAGALTTAGKNITPNLDLYQLKG